MGPSFPSREPIERVLEYSLLLAVIIDGIPDDQPDKENLIMAKVWIITIFPQAARTWTIPLSVTFSACHPSRPFLSNLPHSATYHHHRPAEPYVFPGPILDAQIVCVRSSLRIPPWTACTKNMGSIRWRLVRGSGLRTPLHIPAVARVR